MQLDRRLQTLELQRARILNADAGRLMQRASVDPALQALSDRLSDLMDSIPGDPPAHYQVPQEEIAANQLPNQPYALPPALYRRWRWRLEMAVRKAAGRQILAEMDRHLQGGNDAV